MDAFLGRLQYGEQKSQNRGPREAPENCTINFALTEFFALAVCDISETTISQRPDDECQGEFELGTRISSA